MKPVILGLVFGVAVMVAPPAHADTASVPIGNPYTDTIQLWSEIASALSSIANGLTSLFNGHELAISYPTTPPAGLTAAAADAEPAQPADQETITYTVQAGDTLSGIAQTFAVPLSNILAANDLSQGAILHPGENLIIPDPQTTPATSSGTASNTTSDQTTLSQDVKSANTEPSGSQDIVASAPPTPAFNASNFVTQSELAYVLLALSTSPSSKSAPTTPTTVPPVPLADGNPLIPYAAENNITNLSGVTISNATISGGSVPSSSLTGTIANSIDTATGEIDSLSGSDLTYTAATTTNATSTNLFASNLAAAALSVSGTSTLKNLVLSALNCSTFGNGGKLTTDSSGNVTCAADQGGSGSTVGGADTQVQFNSGGSFTGSSAFTFASSSALLTVINASTSNLTANYSSSTNLVAGNATSTILFATLATFTSGIISTLSGTRLNYTSASTTNLSASGEGSFGTASTTNLTVSGAPSGFLQTNAQGAVSATSTFSAGSLFGTLASVNGTALPANGAITVTAASSTLLGDNNVFSGINNLTNTGSNFAGTWQTFSPSHFQSAGTYLTGIGNYATTTAAAISISTSTQTFNGLTFGNSFAISASDISVAPTVSGTLSNAGLAHSTITLNGTTLTLGDINDTVTAASSTLLANNNTWTGLQSFANASSTLTTLGTTWLSGLTNAVLSTNGNGQLIATTSIGTSLLAGALGTINGTSFSVGGSITVGSASTTLLSDNNTFSGGNLFTASTTIGNGNQNGGLTISGGATTTGTLVVQGSGTSTFLGNIGISGNIVPSADNTYTLGSPSYEWKDVYIGPGSLFVNGQEVVHTDASQNVVLTANSNQNLEMQTSGTGSVLLNSSGTGNIQLAGPVQITGGENFSTSNATPVLFSDGVEPGNLELTGNAIQATNTNGGISFSPNGNGGTYFTNGNVGIGTTNPLSKLEVEGAVAAQNFSATSTTATSTFADGISLAGGCFAVNGTCVGASSASTTLLSDNNTFSGIDTFTNASSNFAGTWQGLSPSHFDTFAYPFPLNATSTTLTFSDGLSALASTTIGNGTQSGGLTISGGATTTANFLVQGTLTAQAAASIGTTLAVNGTTTIASGQGFTVGSSQFVVQQGTGNVGIGTTNPGYTLTVSNAAGSASSQETLTDTSGTADNLYLGAKFLNNWATISAASTNLSLATDNSNVMTLTTGGNVGIGTTNPQLKLDVNGNARVNNYIAGTSGLVLYGDNSSANGVTITTAGFVGIDNTNPGEPFDVAGKFQVDGSGNVTAVSTLAFPTAVTGLAHRWIAGPGAGNGADAFNIVDATAGTGVTLNAGGTSWTSYSDQRLKTNIETLTASSSLAAILQLNPVTFNWKSSTAPTSTQMGFIAQQMQTVFPSFVSDIGSTTITNADGSTTTIPGTLGIAYTDLVVPLVAAVQDIANISSTFEQNLIAWLGSASNGIVTFFAQVGNFQTTNTETSNASTTNTQTLCITNGSNDPSPLCITKSQLAALLSQIASAQTPDSVRSSALQNPTPEIPESVSSTTPPVIQINGANPAIVQIGDTYNDLGATITGPTADLNLGIQTFVNGVATSPVQLDTSSAATDTIDYVATDQNGLTSTTTRTVIIEAPSIIRTDDASSTDATTNSATTTDATSTGQ